MGRGIHPTSSLNLYRCRNIKKKCKGIAARCCRVRTQIAFAVSEAESSRAPFTGKHGPGGYYQSRGTSVTRNHHTSADILSSIFLRVHTINSIKKYSSCISMHCCNLTSIIWGWCSCGKSAARNIDPTPRTLLIVLVACFPVLVDGSFWGNPPRYSKTFHDLAFVADDWVVNLNLTHKLFQLPLCFP